MLLLAPGLTFAEASSANTGGAPKSEGTFAYLTQENGQQLRAPLLAPTSASLAVARVGDENITLEDLMAAIGGAHEAFKPESKAGERNFTHILDRLVDARLVLLEASDMGLGDLEEVKDSVVKYRDVALTDMLKAKALEGARADPADVERRYQEASREWKIKSVLFSKEEDAKALASASKAGKAFDDLVKQAIAEKKAKGGAPAEFLPRTALLPQILVAVQPLKTGGVSAPVRVPEGFALLRVEDVRYPEDPKARAEAQKGALTDARKKALKTYYDGLVKKYVKTNDKLLKSIDFEKKKPGFAALKKDQRVVSTLRGAAPITVADLTRSLEEQFYHSVDGAIREKRVNSHKITTLDALISSRITRLEAVALGLDKTAEYERRVSDFARSALFSAFIQRVVLPDAQVSSEDEAMYYAQHKSEYSFPAFYKLESLTFTSLKDAEAAVKKLRSGTDFKWLRANADHQVSEGEALVNFDGATVAATAMPDDLAKQLAGAKKGDYRLWASEQKQFHAILVLDAIPPEPQPFADAKQKIHDKVFEERVNGSIKAWADKLRKVHPVKIYLTKLGS
jgi:parvulin-like peptidyl-prolyl isomerase